MTDFFIHRVPLPVPRPAIAATELPGADDIQVDPRIFFDKPIDRLHDIWSLPTEKSYILEKIKDMNAQFYGWDSSTPLVSSSTVEILAFLFAMGVITVVVMVVWTAIRLFIEWVVGNDPKDR